MTIEGFWFEPESSTRQDAKLHVANDRYELSVSGHALRDGTLAELAVSDRIGDTPRRLSFPDGAMFETRSNALIDEWVNTTGHSASGSITIHRLENSWKWIGSALLVTVLVSYLGIRYGLPAASESIARRLPASFHDTVSTQGLAALDKIIFDETATSEAKQAQIQQQFDDLLSQLPPSEFEFKLHFRSMKGVSNAMALPGGDVVVTDAFLELIEHPQELDSVLLHEIAHVVEYHGMTQVIRASATSVIVTLAFGDLSALGELAVGVPVFMMQNSYSQSAETEADAYAFERMREMGKDPKYFADIILRMGDEKLETNTDSDNAPGYFSSHPDSQLRARKALEASRASNL